MFFTYLCVEARNSKKILLVLILNCYIITQKSFGHVIIFFLKSKAADDYISGLDDKTPTYKDSNEGEKENNRDGYSNSKENLIFTTERGLLQFHILSF